MVTNSSDPVANMTAACRNRLFVAPILIATAILDHFVHLQLGTMKANDPSSGTSSDEFDFVAGGKLVTAVHGSKLRSIDFDILIHKFAGLLPSVRPTVPQIGEKDNGRGMFV